MCSIREGGGIGNDQKLSRSLGPNLPHSHGRKQPPAATLTQQREDLFPSSYLSFCFQPPPRGSAVGDKGKVICYPVGAVFFSSSLPRGCVSHVA